MGDLPYGTDLERVQAIAREIREVHDRGVEIAIVVGAGNIYRGLAGRRRRAWSAPPPTTWACSPPSSTR